MTDEVDEKTKIRMELDAIKLQLARLIMVNSELADRNARLADELAQATKPTTEPRGLVI